MVWLIKNTPFLVRFVLGIVRRVLMLSPMVYIYEAVSIPFANNELMLSRAMKEMRIRSLHQAFGQGVDGLYSDATLLFRDWGFSIPEVVRSVRIWHGESDPIVDVDFGRQLSRALPNSTCVFSPNDGHHLLYIHWKDILEQVKEDSSLNASRPPIH
jgi:pimeloyl-ACP methyl ester carboxylesterase